MNCLAKAQLTLKKVKMVWGFIAGSSALGLLSDISGLMPDTFTGAAIDIIQR